MQFEYSKHWIEKREYRKDITNYDIEYCICMSPKIKDRIWEDAWNAIVRIPSSGRILKVVYKMKGKSIKIITSYWLE